MKKRCDLGEVNKDSIYGEFLLLRGLEFYNLLTNKNFLQPNNSIKINYF